MSSATDTPSSSVPSSDRVFDIIHCVCRIPKDRGRPAKIARDVGHGSDSALSVAFVRAIGVSPDGYLRSATSDSTS
jgi:AraC-like DNA-binding protein